MITIFRDPDDFGAPGTAASVNAAIASVRGGESGIIAAHGVVNVEETINLRSGITLAGTGAGAGGMPGTTLIAAPGLNGPVIMADGGTDYIHRGGICDLRVIANNQVGGDAGIVMRNLGELWTVDGVMVTGAWGDGLRVSGHSTPMEIGWISVHSNGRSGTGAGLRVIDSIHTANRVRRIDGDNNADALLWVRNLYRSTFAVDVFKAERWVPSGSPAGPTVPGHPNVIVVENGNNGTLVVGTGRVHQGMGVPGGNAIIHNRLSGASNGAYVTITGAIEYDEQKTTYAYDHYSDDIKKANGNRGEWRGRPVVRCRPVE